MASCVNELSPREKRRRKKTDLLVFLLLYVSNDTLLFGTNGNRLFFWLHIAILGCMLLWLVLDKSMRPTSGRERVNMPRSMVTVVTVLCLMTVATMGINFDLSIKYAYQLFMMVFSVIVVLRIEQKDFIASYNKAMYWFALGAVISFAAFKLALPLVHRLPTITNESGLIYYFYGFGFLEDLPASLIPRSYGVFREPGVFSVFLMFAVIFELFFAENFRFKRLAVYILAAIMTFSTMSFIVIPMILVIYAVRAAADKANHTKRLSFLNIMAILVCFLAVILFTGDFDLVLGNVFDKLGVANASRDSRLYSVFTNIDMMLNNPFLGNGWTFVEQNFEAYSLKYSNYGGHNTNTFLKILSVYGVIYCGILLKQMYNFLRKKNNAFISLLLLASVFAILSNEDMIVNIMIYILVFYGMKPRTVQASPAESADTPMRNL